MKTLGLIGGMSWESTVSYYQLINETVKQELGGLHSAKLILYSVDFAEIEVCQAKGEWARSAEILGDAAAALERAGADYIVICTNTMHKVADQIAARIKIPLLHIARLTAQALSEKGITAAGLLGTRFTMQQDFYKKVLEEHGIKVLIPEAEDMALVDRVIYQELCLGEIKTASKEAYLKIINKLAAKGAQGVILGCTEIGLLVKDGEAAVPLFDTAAIHAKGAALAALRG